MKNLVKHIAASLVQSPDQVFVEEVKTANVSILQLRVAREDLGRVIGKNGRTADAIRRILQAVSPKIKKNILLEIVE